MIFKRTKRLGDGTIREYPHYWYKFVWDGRLVRVNTKQPNKRAAESLEADHRTKLARGDVGIRDRATVPTLRQFEPRFMQAIEVRRAEKPKTIAFYRDRMARLLKFTPIADAKLDHIDEQLIEQFVQDHDAKIARATVNRSLATLRRALRLAQEWRIIDRIPRVRLLSGERNREFVLSRKLEAKYLEAAPEPLREAGLLILNTGLRVGEALGLQWNDVHLKPVGSAKFGYVEIRVGKSKNARRNLSLTARANAMLKKRAKTAFNQWVFPGESDRAFVNSSLAHQHSKIRVKLNLPKEFVIHSLRHTMLTRLGEAGVDAFTIMRIAGHSSVTVSQRYVHPTPEAMERAFEKLEVLNGVGSKARGGHTTGTRSDRKRSNHSHIADSKGAGA